MKQQAGDNDLDPMQRATRFEAWQPYRWGRDGGFRLTARWTHTKDGMRLTWVGRACNVYHHWTRWLRPSFWRYIFERSESSAPYWTVVACRLRGHPGIVYFNSGGLEPDTSCRRCGEQIG